MQHSTFYAKLKGIHHRYPSLPVRKQLAESKLDYCNKLLSDIPK